MGNKPVAPSDSSGGEVSLQLMEEKASLSIQRLLDSRTTIVRSTNTEEALLETELLQDKVTVKHVTKNQPVNESYSSDIRKEGDMLIIPVIEEQVEIVRHRILKEEIHIHKVTTKEPYSESVTVRHQEVNIKKEQFKP